MADRVTVLIGAAELLPALRARLAGNGDVVAFTDLESLAAFEAIVTRRPSLVALDHLFASTTRGAALTERIGRDPSLAGVEVRVIAHDREVARVAAGGARPAGPSPAAPAALDQRGTRRAPRVAIASGLEALVDGNPVSLVDLSTIGAQVLSPGVLRPNQRVRLVLPDADGGLRMSATIAWAAFEMPPRLAPRYRAGLQFNDAAPDGVKAFCTRHGRH